jgi:cytidine deaminase
MAELAQNAVVYLANMQGDWVQTSVAQLLPGAFDPNDLPANG